MQCRLVTDSLGIVVLFIDMQAFYLLAWGKCMLLLTNNSSVGVMLMLGFLWM
jgi:hypothetical protein